jgi:hypothetical protein
MADAISALLALEGQMAGALKLVTKDGEEIASVLGTVWYAGQNFDAGKSCMLKIGCYEDKIEGPLWPFKKQECKLIINKFIDAPTTVAQKE